MRNFFLLLSVFLVCNIASADNVSLEQAKNLPERLEAIGIKKHADKNPTVLQRPYADKVRIVKDNGLIRVAKDQDYIDYGICSFPIAKEPKLPPVARRNYSKNVKKNSESSNVEVDGIYYILDEESKTAEVTKGLGEYSGEVIIPSSITVSDKEYIVNKIGDSAFNNSYNLTSVIIPNSVTSIGNEAFYNCTGITYLNIPNSVEEIGHRAFLACGLRSLIISNSLKEIGEFAFSNCKDLESIELPNSITKIGDAAFDQCHSLVSITLPNSISNIASCIFRDCYSLKEVSIPLSVTNIGYGSFDHCTSLKSIYIPKNVMYLDEGVFRFCESLESIVVDEENPVYDSRNNCNAIIETATNTLIEGCNSTIIPNSVKVIGYWCCEGRKLKSIVIPEGVEAILQGAFEYCKELESVSIPSTLLWLEGFTNSGIKSITLPGSFIGFCSGTFAYCKNLTEINVTRTSPNDGYFSIDGVLYCYPYEYPGCLTLLAFPGAKEDIVLPDNVACIFQSSFQGAANIKSLTLPDGLKEIGHMAFDFASLESVILSKGLEKIGEDVFGNCKNMTEVALPDDLPYIGHGMFNGCRLKTVSIPESVREIRGNAFCACDLTSVEIPDGVTSIGVAAFWRCENLESVVIGRNANYIGNAAFEYCESIQAVTNRCAEPQQVEDLFNGLDLSDKTLYVLNSSLEKYKNAERWKDFGTIIGMEDMKIGDANCDGVVTVSDIVATAGHILGTEPEAFSVEQADCDGNGTITVSDIVYMAQYILNGEWPTQAQVKAILRRNKWVVDK